MDIDNILLSNIEGFVPSILANKFKKFGINTIYDLRNLQMDQFRRLPGVGQRSITAVEKLQRIAENDPEKIKSLYKSTFGQELPRSMSGDFLFDMSSLVHEFLEVIGNDFYSDVLFKRYGLYGNDHYTLEGIGVFYGVTRERIRQIQLEVVARIRKLLLGSQSKRPRCRAASTIVEKFLEIRQELTRADILSEQELIEFFRKRGDRIPTKDQNAVFMLLADLINAKIYKHDTQIHYIFNRNIKIDPIERTAKIVKTLLQNKVVPMRLFDIVLQANKADKSITKQHVLYALKIESGFIERLIVGKDEFFQIALSENSSLADFAYRVLYEKQESIHYEEIWRDIQHRLVRDKKHPLVHKRSLTSQLVSDDRFVPIGKSGMWALSEWGQDTSSIIELITRAIFYHNIPCTIDQIADYVAEMRPQVSKSSVQSIISQHRNKLTKLRTGTYIPKEWEKQFKGGIENQPAPNRMSMDNFVAILQEIFEEQSKELISSIDLKKYLKEKGVAWADSTFYARFSACPFLQKIMQKSTVMYSFVQPEEKRTMSKLEQVRLEIERIIRLKDCEPIPLIEIVRAMKSAGIGSPTVYAVISRNPHLFRKTEISNKKMIQLETEPGRAAHDQHVIELIKLIQSGESESLEFKSSLRWDFNNGRLNKELEFVIIKTVAAFLNSDGGQLLVGVDDYGKILGLAKDYKTLKKKNSDGFMLHLNNLLVAIFTKKIFTYVQCSIQGIDSKEICLISIKPAEAPVFVRKNDSKHFFIRGNASVQSLDMEDAALYIRTHWKI